MFALKALVLIIVSVIAVNFLFSSAILGRNETALLGFSTLLSAAISYTWYTYLRWIDAYEPERRKFLFLAFFLSCVSILLVFPITDYVHSFGFNLNGEPLNDFLYCFVGIGMVEEFVKLLPLLVILFFTDQINEPLDYIIYAAMSALGFAFIENIMYLNSTSLEALTGRLLYASVAHMFFASCIAYPLAVNKLKTGKKFSFLWLIVGFLIAALAHGFYDFWLINEKVNFPILTTIFFLGSLHIFTMMKNNLINSSDFFNDVFKINRNKLKYNLIWSILFVIYVGYFLFALLFGSASANALLLNAAIFHVSTVLYIVITFSSMNFIKGYKAPLRFPLKVFLPKLDAGNDFTNTKLSIKFIALKPFAKAIEIGDEAKGILTSRVVLEGDINWYFLFDEEQERAFLIKPKDLDAGFSKNEIAKITAVELVDTRNLSRLEYKKKDLLIAKHGVAKLIS